MRRTMAVVEVVSGLRGRLGRSVSMVMAGAVTMMGIVVVRMRVHRAVGVTVFMLVPMLMLMPGTVFVLVHMVVGVAVHRAIGMPMLVFMGAHRSPFHPRLAFSTTAHRAHR
ncbi:MAG: hypothetical protein LC667_02635 [Thioalkalivibrio sp.]|nr:hypothetical protein [Thioalkalivibrio sp.]